MAAAAGWIIICVGFSLVSVAVLWPAYRSLRRRFPHFRHHVWAYFAATAGFSVALWFLIPLAVWLLFGRTAH
jgi:hypothetical protein